MRGKYANSIVGHFNISMHKRIRQAGSRIADHATIDIRKEAKKKKDFATSDMIRNQLAGLGILLKDEKSGDMSWNIE